MDNLAVCKSCRRCCIGTDIILKQEDIERWKVESRLDILLAINPLIGESRQLIKKKDNDECIFLSQGGVCLIHGTKPLICRRFPVTRKQALAFECKLVDKIFNK